MTELVVGGRQTGKTTKLIEMAAKAERKGELSYIVCHSYDEAYRIAQQAAGMDLSIGFPLTYDEFLSGQYAESNIKKFFVDNADLLLQYISKVPIEAMTLTQEAT